MDCVSNAKNVLFEVCCCFESRYVIFANGDEVRVCSVVSGQCIHRLRGHEKKVTGILLNPDNQFQVRF
jgi:hypothetical protein